MFRQSVYLPSSLTILALAVLMVAPLSASDGVIEINQAKVMAGAITPGDGPGFPATINQPGSYILTGDLSSTNPNVHIVQVEADNVTLDLNGFTVRGPNTCTFVSGPPAQLQCTTVGTGMGVVAASSRGLVVRNGHVEGAGDTGVYCGYCHLQDLQIRWSGQAGVNVGSALVEGCQSTENLVGGFEVAGRIVDSSARQNGGFGFSLYFGTTAEGLRATINVGDGIYLFGGVTLTSCNSSFNGDSAASAAGVSVLVGSAQIRDCVLYGNSGFGINAAGSPSAFAGNVIAENNGGGANPQTSSNLVATGLNLCGSDTTCP